MTVFEYASGLISIVVGLAVARVLGGISNFIALGFLPHPRFTQPPTFSSPTRLGATLVAPARPFSRFAGPFTSAWPHTSRWDLP
jgi:hypothetical protein